MLGLPVIIISYLLVLFCKKRENLFPALLPELFFGDIGLVGHSRFCGTPSK
jgi:hypothetical protein